MTGVRTVLIAQVVLIYMQAIETIRQKHVWCNTGAYEAIAIIGIELSSSGDRKSHIIQVKKSS